MAPSRPRSQQKPAFSRPDWLVSVLRDRIVRGRYKPGERIREADLQQEFELSNGQIGEALQRLVADGVLDRSPWRGVRVIELTQAEIVELFQVRLALLEYAAELAARRADPAVLAEAERVRANLRKALTKVKSGDLALMNAELIEWVLRGTGNKRMLQVWEHALLISRIYAYESMRRTAARTEPLQYKIIDCIVAGDAQGARQAMRELTLQTVKDLNIDAEF